MSSIAHVLRKQGKYREALKIFQQVYDERLIHLGEMHEDTLRTKRDLAVAYMNLTDYDKAYKELSNVVPKFEQVFGELHPDTLATRANLATTLLLQSRLEDAHIMLKDVYEKQKKALGEHQIETLRVKYNIASVLLRQFKIEESLTVFEEVLEGFRIALGLNHPETRKLQTEIDMIRSANMPLNTTETIHWVSKKGQHNAVASLIENGEDVNAKDAEGNCPLHYAAQYNHMEVVLLLLKKGAAYDAKNSKRYTPFQLTRSAEIKELLISVKALFASIKAGNSEQILESHATMEWIVNVKDSTGHTPLHWAAYEGHQDILILLLELGADATSVSKKGNSPLHIAVSKGHWEIVTTLLQSVRSEDMSDFINGRTKSGRYSPLHVAAERGFVDIVKTLLKSGAAYDVQNSDGKTPLQLSGDRNVSNLLQLVHSLFTEARNGSSDLIEKLRNVDGDELLAIRNARDYHKHTLLQILLKKDQQELARNLLKVFKEEGSSDKQEL